MSKITIAESFLESSSGDKAEVVGMSRERKFHGA